MNTKIYFKLLELTNFELAMLVFLLSAITGSIIYATTQNIVI